MNTATAAALLGVSQSTLKRWIKELDLDMNRNELGHFDFNEKDLLILKQIKKQIQSGIYLHNINVSERKIRKGKATTLEKESTSDILLTKMRALEIKLNEKADKVVSYQLLTHRNEIEDLENEIKRLSNRIEQLENLLEEKNTSMSAGNLNTNQLSEKKKTRKKNLITMLFGF